MKKAKTKLLPISISLEVFLILCRLVMHKLCSFSMLSFLLAISVSLIMIPAILMPLIVCIWIVSNVLELSLMMRLRAGTLIRIILVMSVKSYMLVIKNLVQSRLLLKSSAQRLRIDMLLHRAPLPCRECEFFDDGLCKKKIECSVAMDRWCFRDIHILSDACSFFRKKKEKLITETEFFRILRKDSDSQLELF